MEAREILERVDYLSEYGSDEELCTYLEMVCPLYVGNVIGKAAIFNELGSVCRRNGWYEKSERAFLTAVEALEKAEIRDGNYATTINNLAGLYRLSGDFEKSMELFGLCREIYATLPGVPADILASSCNNLGLLHLDKREFAEALDEFQRAEEIIAQIPENAYVHAVTVGNKGYAWYGLGDMERAKECMFKAACFAGNVDKQMQKNYMELYSRLCEKEEA